MTPPPRMIVLIDENVRAAVGELFEARGYEVYSVKKSTFEGEPDPIIAKIGHILSQEAGVHVVIVTHNHKHFVKLVSRRPPENNLRYRNLGRISLLCNYVRSVKRLRETIDDIERELAFCQTRSDKRLIMSINEDEFSIER